MSASFTILPGNIFVRKPFVIGVRILTGKINVGDNVYVGTKRIGTIIEMEKDRKNVTTAEKDEVLCIKIRECLKINYNFNIFDVRETKGFNTSDINDDDIKNDNYYIVNVNDIFTVAK